MANRFILCSCLVMWAAISFTFIIGCERQKNRIDGETVTVTDQAGRVVRVSPKIERIAALHHCDHVIMLKEGRLITDGPTDEAMQDNTLRIALGDNIKIDATTDGVPIVVPKNVGMGNNRAN